jgi:hypothetical protein
VVAFWKPLSGLKKGHAARFKDHLVQVGDIPGAVAAVGRDLGDVRFSELPLDLRGRLRVVERIEMLLLCHG